MDLCTDNLTTTAWNIRHLDAAIHTAPPIRQQTSRLRENCLLAVDYGWCQRAKIPPHLFIGCQIEYSHVYDNHSVMHNAPPSPNHLPSIFIRAMNQKKNPRRITLSESIKVKNRWWCQITTLLSMHASLCVSAASKPHSHTLAQRPLEILIKKFSLANCLKSISVY